MFAINNNLVRKGTRKAWTKLGTAASQLHKRFSGQEFPYLYYCANNATHKSVWRDYDPHILLGERPQATAYYLMFVGLWEPCTQTLYLFVINYVANTTNCLLFLKWAIQHPSFIGADTKSFCCIGQLLLSIGSYSSWVVCVGNPL